MIEVESRENVNPEINTGGNKVFDTIEWGCVILCGIATIGMGLKFLGPISDACLPVTFITLLVFGWVHGTRRYGLKNMGIWFVITFIVSNALEGLSIKTGWPFGFYYYAAEAGPRILEVPVGIMVVYFGISYTAWTVAQVVTGHFSKPLKGIYKFILPVTTGLVMTMFDLCRDPQASTINSTWIWPQGGDYYGVPISNFFGWVLVVYIFMQIFTLFISNKKLDISKDHVTSKKGYWLKAVLIYLFMGLSFVVLALAPHTDHADIYNSMAMISVFTMIFTAGISLLNLYNDKELGK